MIHKIRYHENVTQNSSSLVVRYLKKCVLRRVLNLTKVSASIWKIIAIIIVYNNGKDPKIDHWGTSVFTGKVSHCSSSSLTDCLRLVEY